jgi:hypothetical protein
MVGEIEMGLSPLQSSMSRTGRGERDPILRRCPLQHYQTRPDYAELVQVTPRR